MTRKIFDTLAVILTQTYLWAFLLIWTIFVESNYEPSLIIGNFLCSAILVLIFLLITNKPSFSVFLTLVVSSLLDFATDIKAEFLSTVLTFSDLNFLFHIHELAGEELVSSYMTTSFLLYCILSVFVVIFIFIKSPSIYCKKKCNSYLFIRILMLVAAYGIFYIVPVILKKEESYFHIWLAKIKANHISGCQKTFKHQNLERVICYSMGSFLDIASSLSETKLKGIELSTNSELIKAELDKEEPKIIKSELPNVILILNESTFNPAYMDYDFAKNLKFDFFDDTKYLKGKGILKVHTFGGGSSLSEFPSVTGIIHDVFTGPTSYPFINMPKITKSSIFRSLNNAGYYSVVIYPIDKKFVNAEVAFKELGADKVVSIEDYNFKPANWRDVPEKVLADMIDAEIKKAPEGMPVFVSVATMRNHGPHNTKIKTDNAGCKNIFKEKTCSKFNDYIERLKLTDKEWMEYTNRIMAENKRTVMINFGDHLPSFEGDMDEIKFKYDDIKEQDIYRTFYNVRANFDTKDYSYPVMDISFLPSLILDIIGRNDSEFYRASSLIRSKCNGLLLECKLDGKMLESYKALMIEQVDLR